jgi:ppGpp synthetase/RelA/SpoT-type nucleotidyltranferase
MAWVEPQYTPELVNAAGTALVRFLTGTETGDDLRSFNHYMDVINNWRAAHNYPLNTFQINLRSSAKRIDSDALIAQRIKRLVSIGAKLENKPRISLSEMQDIGGCRTVLSTVDNARNLVDFYHKTSRIKHELLRTDDYITNPKKSGYRSVHLIYRYFSDKNKTAYNGLKIEMQIRSKYQHAWATAVETVGAFIGESLKSNIGSKQWLRFFALMGSAIAMREKTPLVPKTPDSRKTLIAELTEYANRLDVARRLNGYASALKYIKNDVEDAHWYLLRLNPSKQELLISGFKHTQHKQAEEEYAKAEELVRVYPGTDAVLVSVDSVSALEHAYPNYFADTGVFLELMNQALSGRSRGIKTMRLKATETKPISPQLFLPDFE